MKVSNIVLEKRIWKKGTSLMDTMIKRREKKNREMGLC